MCVRAHESVQFCYRWREPFPEIRSLYTSENLTHSRLLICRFAKISRVLSLVLRSSKHALLFNFISYSPLSKIIQYLLSTNVRAIGLYSLLMQSKHNLLSWPLQLSREGEESRRFNACLLRMGHLAWIPHNPLHLLAFYWQRTTHAYCGLLLHRWQVNSSSENNKQLNCHVHGAGYWQSWAPTSRPDLHLPTEAALPTRVTGPSALARTVQRFYMYWLS